MQLTQYSGLSRSQVEQLLLYIPTFRQIKQHCDTQFQLMLASARVIAATPGTRLVGQSSQTGKLFFVLRGQLDVILRRDGQCLSLKVIEAGEVFGELALLLDQNHSADVVVANSCRQSLVLCLDGQILQDPGQFSMLDQTAQTILYQNLVHHLRWQLDSLRRQYPSHALANKHRQLKLLSRLQRDVEPLQAHYHHAKALARLLLQWNPRTC